MAYAERHLSTMKWEQLELQYTSPCPCGDFFMVTLDDLFYGEDIAECDSCSLHIRVLFESHDLPDVEFETDDDEILQENEYTHDAASKVTDIKIENCMPTASSDAANSTNTTTLQTIPTATTQPQLPRTEQTAHTSVIPITPLPAVPPAPQPTILAAETISKPPAITPGLEPSPQHDRVSASATAPTPALNPVEAGPELSLEHTSP